MRSYSYIEKTYVPNEDLQVHANEDGSVTMRYNVYLIPPTEIFQPKVLADNNPFTQTAISIFMDNLTDAAVHDILKKSQK